MTDEPAWLEMPLTDWPYTPPLDTMRKLLEADPHLFWKVDIGHVQNTLESALDALDEAEAALERVRTALANHPRTHGIAAPNYPCGWKNVVAEIEWALAPVTEEGDGE